MEVSPLLRSRSWARRRVSRWACLTLNSVSCSWTWDALKGGHALFLIRFGWVGQAFHARTTISYALKHAPLLLHDIIDD